MVEAKVDNETKIITFLPQSQIDPRFFISQGEARRAENARQSAAYPDEELLKCSKPWFDSAKPGRAGIRFDDTKIVSSGALQIALDWMNATFLHELSDDYQLGQFSAGALRRVIAAIHVASLFRVRLEDVLDVEGTPVVSHVLTLRWHELVEWIHGLSDVSQAEISAIISLLTFGNERERVTLAHKPFVLGCDDQVYFAPRLLLSLNLPQMLVGAMNLTQSGQSEYNAVSNQITSSFTKDVGVQIKVGCLSDAQCVSEKTFQLPTDDLITPDIVLLSPDAEELLVIDVKSAVPPFGVTYIYDDLLDLERAKEKRGDKEGWKPKMRRYVSAFQGSPQILSQHFNVNDRISPRVYAGHCPFPLSLRMDLGQLIGQRFLRISLTVTEADQFANCMSGFVTDQTLPSFRI